MRSALVLASLALVAAPLCAATPDTADLAVSKTFAKVIPPPPSATSSLLTLDYLISVYNSGPATATAVTVTDVIPPGTGLVSATPTQGSCSGTSTVTCNLGNMSSATLASVRVVLTSSSAGPVSNTATVSSSTPDPNAANNSSTATITVVAALSIPALSPTLLLLLAVAIAAIGSLRLRV